jgi:hypothetical protein
MYCSACGVAVISGLKYCNHCGARLREPSEADEEVKPSELFSESLVWAIVTVFIVGLGCVLALMVVMKEVLHFENHLILAIVTLSFSLIFLLEGVFIWLLLSSRRIALEAMRKAEARREREFKSLPSSEDLVTKELYAPPASEAARALAEPQDVPSVVDHTTQSLEPVLVERKTK